MHIVYYKYTRRSDETVKRIVACFTMCRVLITNRGEAQTAKFRNKTNNINRTINNTEYTKYANEFMAPIWFGYIH